MCWTWTSRQWLECWQTPCWSKHYMGWPCWGAVEIKLSIEVQKIWRQSLSREERTSHLEGIIRNFWSSRCGPVVLLKPMKSLQWRPPTHPHPRRIFSGSSEMHRMSVSLLCSCSPRFPSLDFTKVLLDIYSSYPRKSLNAGFPISQRLLNKIGLTGNRLVCSLTQSFTLTISSFFCIVLFCFPCGQGNCQVFSNWLLTSRVQGAIDWAGGKTSTIKLQIILRIQH